MATDPAARLRAAVDAVGGQAAALRLLADVGAPLPERTLTAWLIGERRSSAIAITAALLERLAGA